jgi:predicted hotdog family 3-hydroxylacyl-ACP dehydratase
MLLVDEMLELDDSKAASKALVRDDWPLIDNGFLGQTLLVEIVAQTVAAVYGWRRLQGGSAQRGYLVGIKKRQIQLRCHTCGEQLDRAG